MTAFENKSESTRVTEEVVNEPSSQVPLTQGNFLVTPAHGKKVELKSSLINVLACQDLLLLVLQR